MRVCAFPVKQKRSAGIALRQSGIMLFMGLPREFLPLTELNDSLRSDNIRIRVATAQLFSMDTVEGYSVWQRDKKKEEQEDEIIVNDMNCLCRRH
ncbi:MAG: hypothetical protein ACLTNO_06640 [Blautia sp.]